MKRLAGETGAPTEPQYYTTTINDRCGFVVAKECGKRLLWITFGGRLEFFECKNLEEVMGVLNRAEIVRSFSEEWGRAGRSEEPFDAMWEDVIADVREKCGRWEGTRETLVPDRVKRQLLWAFDAAGNLDGDRFVTILAYEPLELTLAELAELANEMTRQPQRMGFSINSN